MEKLVADYDSGWKEIVEQYFQPLMEFMLPQVAAEIDWRKPYTFLDKEFQAIQPKAQVVTKNADKLVQVYIKNGTSIWVLIHIEIQSQYHRDFAARMFEYYYRIYDKYKKTGFKFSYFSR